MATDRAARVAGVILAGGLGSRMRPLTDRMPKPLLPVAGRPLVVHQIERLRDAGVVEIALATSYRAEDFRPVLGDGQRWGLRLHYVTEPRREGTGGGLLRAIRHLRAQADSPFDACVVMNGDLLTSHSLPDQLAFHDAHAAHVTIHAFHVPDASRYGLLTTEGEAITAFAEKPAVPTPGLVNAGTYVIDPMAVTDCAQAFTQDLAGTTSRHEHTGGAGKSPAEISLERDVFPALIASRHRVVAFTDDTPFTDIGTPQALLAANVAAHRAGATFDLCEGAFLTPSCHVDASVVLPGAHIAARAFVVGSVVGRGVSVGASARVVNSVIGEGAVIDAGADVSGQTVPTDARIHADGALD